MGHRGCTGHFLFETSKGKSALHDPTRKHVRDDVDRRSGQLAHWHKEQAVRTAANLLGNLLSADAESPQRAGG